LIIVVRNIYDEHVFHIPFFLFPVFSPTPSNRKFSATGGADSRPVSEKGSPTEDQAGMVGNGNKLAMSLMRVPCCV
jgi:hypothetical protein